MINKIDAERKGLDFRLKTENSTKVFLKLLIYIT